MVHIKYGDPGSFTLVSSNLTLIKSPILFDTLSEVLHLLTISPSDTVKVWAKVLLAPFLRTVTATLAGLSTPS